MKNIPILDEVVFAFHTLAARLFGALLSLMLDIILIRDGFGANKAPFKIRMDHARRIGAVAPLRTVQARASFGPQVKKVVRSSRA